MLSASLKHFLPSFLSVSVVMVLGCIHVGLKSQTSQNQQLKVVMVTGDRITGISRSQTLTGSDPHWGPGTFHMQ